MNNEKRTVKYDERRKELIVTSTIDEMQAPDGTKSKDFGNNKNVAIITEKGLKVFIKDLQKQKTGYQQNHKAVDKQLGEIRGLIRRVLEILEKIE